MLCIQVESLTASQLLYICAYWTVSSVRAVSVLLTRLMNDYTFNK